MNKLSSEKVRLISQQLSDHYIYHNKKSAPEEKKGEITRDQEMDDIIHKLESNDSSLIELKIENKIIHPDTLIRLTESLAGNTVLTKLELVKSPLGSTGVSILADGIKQNNSLTCLCFFDNKIDCDGAITLANAIRNKNNFVSLVIKANYVRDNGAIAMAEVLRENKSLKCLDLMSNGITDVGAAHLAKAIEINTTLKEIVLSGNPITDQGGLCIAKSLEKNSTLKQIQLITEAIGDIVAKEFISVLATNGSLTCLKINSTDFRSAVLLFEIKKICERNKPFCEHYEKVLPKMIHYSLGFFCKVPKDLRSIVIEYCEGEYPRYSAQ